MGWTQIPLEEIVEILDAQRVPINSGERAQRIKDKDEAELYPYYGATGQVGYIDDFLFDQPLILLGEDGVPFFDPLRTKAYQVSGKCWVNNHAHVLQVIEKVADQRYVSAFLNSFDYTGYVSGSTRLKLTQALMKSIPVALAPLNEQKRIADKLDRLLAKVDACRERCDRIPLILKRFRQSVLAAATSGELTEDWRESNNHSPRTSWQSLLIGDLVIGKPRNGYSPKAVEFETKTKSLTLTATTSGRFNPKHFKYINEIIPQDSHLWLEPEDILIQRANTLEYVGMSAIYNGPPKVFIYPDLMMKCKANSKVITKFLYYLLSSDDVRSYFRDNATGTAGNMPKINQQTVIAAPALVPPIEEQQEIVRRVEKLFTFADRLESRYQTARAKCDQLTPALLEKAFQGELVPQDPNDEPASVLLERIKSLRSSMGTYPIKPHQRNTTSEKSKSYSFKVKMLKRKDIQPSHLSDILKASGSLSAEALWTASQLEIDDFYDQLKDEEAQNLLKETRAENSDAFRLLEAA
jgi:type I restriction enzyme, S subunit